MNKLNLTYILTPRMTQLFARAEFDIVESTAVKVVLHITFCLITGYLPALLGDCILLLGVDGEARAGQGELKQEQEEQDDHVLEKVVKEILNTSLNRSELT